MKVLTEIDARRMGAGNAEEVIQYVCRECTKGNLDFKGDEFCPVQVEYGFDGEHPSIVFDGRGVWCLERDTGKKKSLTDEERGQERMEL